MLDNKYKYRELAMTYATEAKRRMPRDTVAAEVLRRLEVAPIKPRHNSPAAAMTLAVEGELLCGERNYDGGVKKLEDAINADAGFTDAMVLMGRCLTAQKKLVEAEAVLRRATQLDPLDNEAWRFLAESLNKQGKAADAIDATYRSIAALPSYRPAWEMLAALLKDTGAVWEDLQFKPKFGVFIEEVNKKLQAVPEYANIDSTAPDNVIWLFFEMNRLYPAGRRELSAFEKETAAWNATDSFMRQVYLKKDSKFTDKSLLNLQKFVDERRALAPAVFLLSYKEAFRAEFEEWKKDNPGGVRSFIENYSKPKL